MPAGSRAARVSAGTCTVTWKRSPGLPGSRPPASALSATSPSASARRCAIVGSQHRTHLRGQPRAQQQHAVVVHLRAQQAARQAACSPSACAAWSACRQPRTSRSTCAAVAPQAMAAQQLVGGGVDARRQLGDPVTEAIQVGWLGSFPQRRCRKVSGLSDGDRARGLRGCATPMRASSCQRRQRRAQRGIPGGRGVAAAAAR